MPLSRTLATFILEEKASLNQVIELLTKYKMLALLPAISKALVQMSRSKSASQVMMIESPFPLSPDAVDTIKHITNHSTVPHEVHINTSILAGFKARYQGMLYDGSAERIIKLLTARQ